MCVGRTEAPASVIRSEDEELLPLQILLPVNKSVRVNGLFFVLLPVYAFVKVYGLAASLCLISASKSVNDRLVLVLVLPQLYMLYRLAPPLVLLNSPLSIQICLCIQIGFASFVLLHL